MNEETHAGAAVVGGEQQVHEMPRADQELGSLRAVVLSDQRRRVGWPVSDLQSVIVDFCLKSAEICIQLEKQSCINLYTFPKYLHSLIAHRCISL